MYNRERLCNILSRFSRGLTRASRAAFVAYSGGMTRKAINARTTKKTVAIFSIATTASEDVWRYTPNSTTHTHTRNLHTCTSRDSVKLSFLFFTFHRHANTAAPGVQLGKEKRSAATLHTSTDVDVGVCNRLSQRCHGGSGPIKQCF